MSVKRNLSKRARKVEPSKKASVGDQTSSIANKLARSQQYANLKHTKRKEKKAAREKAKREAAKAEQLGIVVPKKIPRTIENTRERDETVVRPEDTEVLEEEAEDEFADYFRRERRPKVLLTTNYKPSAIMYAFLSELLEVFPNATYYKRQGYALKKIVKYASNRDFTDLLVFNEDRKKVNGALLVHLPGGPTAHFKLSNLVLSRDIKGHGRPDAFKSELILKNFDTRLGRRVGRMFASLFDQDPQFRGRQVATFHNQRDYIFFRHHRYIFEEKERRGQKSVTTRLQELGPRFTLKLRSLQKGTFDSRGGEYEWLHKHEMDTSRRRFFL